MVKKGGGKRPSASQQARLRSQHRKWLPCSLSWCFFVIVAICVVGFLVLGFSLQSLNAALPVLRRGGGGSEISVEPNRSFGGVLRFVPSGLHRRLRNPGGIERLRSEQHSNSSIRPPRLVLVADKMNKNPQSLMLLTLVKGLTKLGYTVTAFALQNGDVDSLWKHAGCQVSILSPDVSSVDWLNYEGVILSSLEANQVMSSLMQDPFRSLPIIWLIHEDILGKRLSSYAAFGWQHLITMWKSAFSRADVVVFPDLTLPMLYTSLDTGNFFVISGSPADVWVANSFNASHSRNKIRMDNGFNEDELIVVVIGSYIFYDEFPWDYDAVMSALSETSIKDLSRTMKFIFLCGNSTEPHFQELASRMGFPDGFLTQYAIDGDLNALLLMADIVLYGSFQEEQSFPPLLVRAMSLEIPVIVPNLSIIKKYVDENVHAMMFNHSQPDSLARAFSFLVEDRKISVPGRAIASNGKFHSRNMLASECIADYANLLEHVLQFPSDVFLPDPVSRSQQKTWLWDFFEKDIKQTASSTQVHNFTDNSTMHELSIVDVLEEQYINRSTIQDVIGSFTPDIPTEVDWSDVSEIEISEDIVRREMQELDERKERNLGSWDIIYNNVRKAEKMNFEQNERDENELVRTGQSLCIYEIYNAEGSWPFLYRSPLYRGINLLKRASNSNSEDVDAVHRLPILNNTYYKDLLCELGAMFSVANKVDNIHNVPWVGFQSWRAVGRNISLTGRAENVLEETIQTQSKGNVLFYWAPMDFHLEDKETRRNLDFWSMCDILNAGNCRVLFEDAFRHMYGLPDGTAALPPMPVDGGKWSTLHSWVMPTDSFVEFMMFSRMFVDSLHISNRNISGTTWCMLGSTPLEKRHCYCRVLEVLVNVWAYHSAMDIVYIHPGTGKLEEQHPLEQRRGHMWVKYFTPDLLKTMDEDLAEAADDGIHPVDRWLWPLTGEVIWHGILDREREDRYRRKMDKKRRMKEKLLDRQKKGYKQKPISGRKNQ